MMLYKILIISFLISFCPAVESFAVDSVPGQEVINYDIKKLGMKAGEAQLSIVGSVEFEGQKFLLITFRAEALKFLDEEQIFMDPKTLYPLVVKRNLNLWGKKEVITERYSQTEGRIKITKLAGGKTTEQTIVKQGPIDNIYCFIYRYRQSGAYKDKQVLSMHLPTKDVKIKSAGIVKLSVGEKDYKAIYLQSDPKQYHLWFEVAAARVPLRIDGSLGMGKTSLVISTRDK